MLSPHHLSLFEAYLDELLEWNRKVNLIGFLSAERVVIELFLDSLIPAPVLPERGLLLDAGSGAGFPGIPLKIYLGEPDIHLLESRSKRVSFLKHITRKLSLQGVTVIQGRLQDRELPFSPGGYPLITARALAPLHKTVVMCSPLLCAGGILVSFLGKEGPKDLGENKTLFRRFGLQVRAEIPYRLPGKKTDRLIVLLEKTMIEDAGA